MVGDGVYSSEGLIFLFLGLLLSTWLIIESLSDYFLECGLFFCG